MSNVKKMTQREPRHRRTRAVIAFIAAVVLAAGFAAPALAATAKFTSLGYGVRNTVKGHTGSDWTKTYGFVGAFHIRIDGGSETESYCVDIHNPISIGDSEPQVTPDYPCEVVYILNNAYPHTNRIGSKLWDVNREAAAVQAAIWHYTDGFVVTSPSDIVNRANQIIDAARSQCMTVAPVPQTITLTPPSAINYLPADKVHTVTATVTGANGQPIVGQAVDIVVTGAAGPQTFHGGTNASGQLTISYTNGSVVTGTDTITATASYTLPIGLKFKKSGKQGIVLAGNTCPGKLKATASKNWVAAKCGDGIVNQSGEQCDDGNKVNGDGCDNNCTPTRCGNGIVTAGEECDDGNAASGDGCDANCTVTDCGNGIVTAGEECDDGNTVNGDGCDNNCTVPRCGNGIVTGNEECDDGNHVNGDSCDNNCTEPRCGNGIVTAGEECDDGNTVDGDGCDGNCTKPACGNGVVTAGELCDDANTVSGDGCDVNCTVTGCGNGIVTLGEECDDGNLVDGDGCESDCTLPRCGNGIVEGDEECDDGNTVDGDGCSADCHQQEVCLDLQDNDGDGLIDCDDPDCPPCLPILKDPAVLKFNKRKLDTFTIHGGLDPITPIDPVNEGVGIIVTNDDGVVYKATLLPNDLIARRPGNLRFVDRKARTGEGSRDGIYEFKLRTRADHWVFGLRAYGNLRAATLPVMGVQVLIGDDAFFYKSEWKRTPTGWKTDFRFAVQR